MENQEELPLLKPRNGRRDGEPHAEEITYLYNLFRSNFLDDHTIWNIHHYFPNGFDILDLLVDISYFPGWHFDRLLTSFYSVEYKNRIPKLIINILSRYYWKKDVGEHLDFCRLLKIPLYIIFAPYHVASETYKPPFLRVYAMKDDGEYGIQELHEITLKEGGEINPDAIIKVGSLFPFNFGLMQLKRQLEGGKPLYRLILLDTNNSILSIKYKEL